MLRLRWLEDGADARQTNYSFIYGNSGDQPLVGNWDGTLLGSKTDTVGLHRSNTFYLTNSNTSPVTNVQFIFGDPTDKGVAGDWNNDVKTTIGIYRSGGVWALNDQNDGSAAEYSFTYGGTVGESYITGNWDNANGESIGVVR